MKKFLNLMFLLFVVLGAVAKSDKMPQYDITGAGSGTEGTVLVKVYVYSKSVSENDLKRAAVHGIVFRTGHRSFFRTLLNVLRISVQCRQVSSGLFF